jgi:hypothetical protein
MLTKTEARVGGFHTTHMASSGMAGHHSEAKSSREKRDFLTTRVNLHGTSAKADSLLRAISPATHPVFYSSVQYQCDMVSVSSEMSRAGTCTVLYHI